MSLAELTRNCFQSGVTPHKWIQLCKLFLSKDLGARSHGNVEVDLSNSVLVLFRSYTGDPDLQEYLKHAIQDGSLSIATFVATLLQAARSAELHAPATLDMLCRIALEAHYSSGLSSIGSVIAYDESPITVLGIVQDALALLRTAYTLPLSHFHRLTSSASELLILLLSCVSDISQIPTAQAMVHVADANDLLQNFRLAPDVRQVLETFVLSLSLLIGDDAKAAREAQFIHTMQLTLEKGNIHGPTSETDIVTFSLVLNHLVTYKAHEFGSGDGQTPVALLVALFRWAAWTPTVFYTQMFHSAFTCLSQSTFNALVWKDFVIGRLPQLLTPFESAVNAEGVSAADWRRALQGALQTNFRRSELITLCDQAIGQVKGLNATQEDEMSRSICRNLLQNLLHVELVSVPFAAETDPFFANNSPHRLQVEAQDYGVDLEVYLESKFAPDINLEDLYVWINRVSNDETCHCVFSAIILRRFTFLATTFDVDALSHLCKILYTYEVALDIMALHVKISNLIFLALSFLDQYDCETVGDPQTAVSHLGNVVLFVQYTTTRFHLESDTYSSDNRTLSTKYLKYTDVIYPVESLSGEDAVAFTAWYKALFDSSSEGIEDSILRSTQPKILLKISATLFLHAIKANLLQKIDRDTLNNGVSYFMGPLLNWTLVGIIMALIKETLRKGYVTARAEVIQTVLLSPLCPRPVLKLCAPKIVILLGIKKGKANTPTIANVTDITPLRHLIAEVLGIRAEEYPPESPLVNRVSWQDEPRQAIQNALASARNMKASSIDIERCIKLMSPTTFLQLLWSELVVCASMGEMEISRRIATFVLTMPRGANSPPLLPIFLHVVMPSLVFATDHQQPPEHTVNIELLVSILSSALTAALHLELAFRSVTGVHRFTLGQPISGMARKLAADLRAQEGHTSRTILQRLTSSQTFATNFPGFMSELG